MCRPSGLPSAVGGPDRDVVRKSGVFQGLHRRSSVRDRRRRAVEQLVGDDGTGYHIVAIGFRAELVGEVVHRRMVGELVQEAKGKKYPKI